jgi:hypothetical protein
LWPSVAAMYENLCGSCVNGVELIRCDQLKNKSPFTQLPHKSSYIVATLGHNNLESPNTLILIKIYPVTTIVLNK